MGGRMGAISVSFARSLAVVLVLLSIAGCTTQLAPAYDQSVLDNLNAANKDIQTLFAKIGPGAAADTVKDRKDSYVKIVGELNALVIQIKARPSPVGAVNIQDVNKVLADMKIAGIETDPKVTDTPSARSVQDEADSIGRMRTHDEKYGLEGGALASFKGDATVYMTQAIAYETFLKR